MRQVGLILEDGFQSMALSALSAFEFANHELGSRGYRLTVLSEDGGIRRSTMGVGIETVALGVMPDTLMVAGGLVPRPVSNGLAAFVARAGHEARRVAGICTGAFVLAQAGLLQGRLATTHWAYTRQLQKQFPHVAVDPDRIYIQDGAVWTSAGMTAGIDLTLALIEEDHGAGLAKSIARKLVVYHRRPGGQSQFSAMLELEPRSDRIKRALTHARENLTNPLTVDELADAASLSPRQFARVFREETGQSPAKAVEILRLEAAKLMLEEGRHPMEIVARDTGFADRDRMRRAFLRAYGQPPASLKRTLAA
ncbi:GlxA family transcriptional regulator [Cypionkella sinensis]|uniref:GlxA family transcriptional regulator n=1 Tax=Cypionkella sinensis TaxID=1756043 RepID=A0ABV7J0E5_9RHOB